MRWGRWSAFRRRRTVRTRIAPRPRAAGGAPNDRVLSPAVAARRSEPVLWRRPGSIAILLVLAGGPRPAAVAAAGVRSGGRGDRAARGAAGRAGRVCRRSFVLRRGPWRPARSSRSRCTPSQRRRIAERGRALRWARLACAPRVHRGLRLRRAALAAGGAARRPAVDSARQRHADAGRSRPTRRPQARASGRRCWRSRR